jgi:hypothetical protein
MNYFGPGEGNWLYRCGSIEKAVYLRTEAQSNLRIVVLYKQRERQKMSKKVNNFMSFSLCHLKLLNYFPLP